MPTENRREIHVTPVLTVIRWNLSEPDEQRKLPTGQTVGDNKYKIVGFFDPDSPDGRAFVSAVTKIIGGGPKAKEALEMTLPMNKDLNRPIPEIPENWRRLTAKTQYGPIEVIDRSGQVVKEPDREIYAGTFMRAAVLLIPFDDPRLRGAKNATAVLKTAILLGGGELIRRGGGGGPSVDPRKLFASEIWTNVDPMADDPPF